MAIEGKELAKFKEYFADFAGNYVIIGGTACSVILRDSAMRPRTTRDIDMILVIEEMTPEFGRQFWHFIKDGEYEIGERKREEGKEPAPELYRFSKPKQAEFPYQIELLSKHPDILGVPTGFHLAPIPVGEDISSLSAILLDDGFYYFTLEHSTISDGLHIADYTGLMCLKIKAYLNLLEMPKAHGHDINKHMFDVFKLVAGSSMDEAIAVPDPIKQDIAVFISKMEELMPNQPLQDSIQRNEEFIAAVLVEMKRIFGV